MRGTKIPLTAVGRMLQILSTPVRPRSALIPPTAVGRMLQILSRPRELADIGKSHVVHGVCRKDLNHPTNCRWWDSGRGGGALVRNDLNDPTNCRWWDSGGAGRTGVERIGTIHQLRWWDSGIES